MIRLHSDLRKAIDETDGPVELVDPTTDERFFVVTADMFERLMATLDLGELTESERLKNLQAFGKAAGWEDSESAIFDDLDRR